MSEVWIGIVLLILGACYAQVPVDPEVETAYGTVRGKAVALSSGSPINTYLGVPYAKAPVGDLRFQAPQEPDAWSSPYEAFEPGNACIQAQSLIVNFTHDGWTRYSEDCLHMDIYAAQGSSNLPVMVFIHGGSFQEGADFQTPGYFMAEKDVVFVSINYRLGILGFAYTGDETIPGNVGLLDLIQALTFIQDNIASFGGDATRVTISGQSAGGAAVGFLVMSPLAEGLFHNAILQSGNELLPWSYLEPASNPENYIISVAETFDCPTGSNQEMVDCLRLIEADSLISAKFNCTPGYICLGFQPVVDGVSLPDTPLNIRQSGSYNKVPEMIGFTEDEYSAYLPYVFPNISTDGVSRRDFDRFLYTEVSDRSQILPNMDRVDDIYQAFRFYYADWPYFDDPYKNRDMIARLLTDKTYGYGSDFQAKSHSNDGNDVYFYVYNYVMSNRALPKWMGAVHAEEIAAQFGWPFMNENEEAFIHSQANPKFSISNHTDLDKGFSSFFMTLWTNFAKYGNPTPEPVLGPDDTAILWPKFEPISDQRYYMNFKEATEVLLDYRQKEFAFWTEYIINYLSFGN